MDIIYDAFLTSARRGSERGRRKNMKNIQNTCSGGKECKETSSVLSE